MKKILNIEKINTLVTVFTINSLSYSLGNDLQFRLIKNCFIKKLVRRTFIAINYFIFCGLKAKVS